MQLDRGELADPGGTLRSQSERLATELLAASSAAAPLLTVRMLAQAALSLRIAREEAQDGYAFLKCLLNVAWSLGFSVADIEGWPRNLNAARAQLNEVQAAELEEAKQLQALRGADAGRRGLDIRHAGSRAMKAWATREAAAIPPPTKRQAHLLRLRLPAEFEGVCSDPETVIYRHLRQVAKEKA